MTRLVSLLIFLHIFFSHKQIISFLPIPRCQDQVGESDRCVVGGVQNSLQSTMDMMGYVMGIVISNPQVVNHVQHLVKFHFNVMYICMNLSKSVSNFASQDFWKLNLLSFGAVTGWITLCLTTLPHQKTSLSQRRYLSWSSGTQHHLRIWNLVDFLVEIMRIWNLVDFLLEIMQIL